MTAFRDLLLAILLLGGVDLALFHGRLYVPLMEPLSFSGRVEEMLERKRLAHERHPDLPKLLVIGNSVSGCGIGEGQLQRQLTERGVDVRVLNLAQGGSSPSSWYVLLKNTPLLEASAGYVVYGLLLPQLHRPGSQPSDLALIKTRLRWTDGIWLARTFARDSEEAAELVARSLFRTPLFREDLRSLLANPTARLERVRSQKELHREYLFGVPRDELKAGRDTGRVRQVMQRRPPPGVDLDREQLDRLVEVAELLQSHGIKLILAILPSGPRPLSRYDSETVGRLEAALERGGVRPLVFFSPELLRTLERQRYFLDRVHLNEAGRGEYTSGLAQYLSEYQPLASREYTAARVP